MCSPKCLRILAAALLLTGASAITASAQDNTDDLEVTAEVEAITTMEISGGPVNLVLDTVVGGLLQDAVDSSATYAIFNNVEGKKIVGSFGEDEIPAGLDVRVLLQAPTNATATQRIFVPGSEDEPQDLVTGVDENTSHTSRTITLTLHPTTSNSVVPVTPEATLTLTLTIVDEED